MYRKLRHLRRLLISGGGRRACGGKLPLPIGESSVFSLRTAAASRKGLLWAYSLTARNFFMLWAYKAHSLCTLLLPNPKGLKVLLFNWYRIGSAYFGGVKSCLRVAWILCTDHCCTEETYICNFLCAAFFEYENKQLSRNIDESILTILFQCAYTALLLCGIVWTHPKKWNMSSEHKSRKVNIWQRHKNILLNLVESCWICS